MTTLYKLTDLDGYTRRDMYGETRWSEGFTKTADGFGGLCGPGFVHAYTDPLLAVFLNPIHARIDPALMWLCEGVVAETDYGLKVGCTSLTTLYQMDVPVVTTEQCIRFGILCAREVCDEPDFVAWSDAWLNGTDRTVQSAKLAAPALQEKSFAAAQSVWAAAFTHETKKAPWAASPAKAAAEIMPLDLIGLARQAMAEEA